MACGLVGLSRSAYRCPLQADTRAVPDRALHDTGFVRTRRSTRRGYRCAYHSARGEAGASIIRRSSGSGGRRACGALGVGAANASVPRPSTRRQRPRRTRSGQSISSSMPTSKAERSRSAPSSMNTPANASAGSWNAPSPLTGSPTGRTSTTTPGHTHR